MLFNYHYNCLLLETRVEIIDEMRYILTASDNIQHSVGIINYCLLHLENHPVCAVF